MTADLFGRPAASGVQLREKIAELKREIKVRKRVYPRWVQTGKLDGPLADYRITVLRAILKDYENQLGSKDANQEKEGRQGRPE